MGRRIVLLESAVPVDHGRAYAPELLTHACRLLTDIRGDAHSRTHLHILQRMRRREVGTGVSDGVYGNLANISVSTSPSPSSGELSVTTMQPCYASPLTHHFADHTFQVEHTRFLVALRDFERCLVEDLELAHEAFVRPAIHIC